MIGGSSWHYFGRKGSMKCCLVIRWWGKAHREEEVRGIVEELKKDGWVLDDCGFSFWN